MRLVVNILWFLSACLCNALVVRIHAVMCPIRVILYGAPPIFAHPFQLWESQFLFSSKSPTCATRRLRFFQNRSFFSPKNICSHCDRHRFIVHVVIALVTLIMILLSLFPPHIRRSSLNLVIQSLINFPWRKCFHPIINWSATSPHAISEWSSVTWISMSLPTHLMHYMRRDRFYGPKTRPTRGVQLGSQVWKQDPLHPAIPPRLRDPKTRYATRTRPAQHLRAIFTLMYWFTDRKSVV